MNAEISSPLRDIIQRAAQRKVEGPITKLKKRFEDAGDAVVVLADVSGSMADPLGSLNLSKWDQLKAALADVEKFFPGIHILAFGSYARAVDGSAKLPPARDGNTNLAQGLKLAAELSPRKTIVISDGLPDSDDAAFAVAEAMTGAIDTIYCGPEDHDEPINFMRKLSRDTGGTQATWNGYRELTHAVRALLPAPEAVK